MGPVVIGVLAVTAAVVILFRAAKTTGDGCGTPPDLEKAENGDANAQVEVGAWWHRRRTRKGYREARRWYTAAAAQGDDYGFLNLGVLHLFGHGVPKDPGRAAALFARAAGTGSSDAAFHLGSMHYDGNGLSADLRKAMFWYKIAARRGSAPAMYCIAGLYERGLMGEHRRSEAWNWYRAAVMDSTNPGYLVESLTRYARLKAPHAMGCLGLLHQCGRGGLHDRQKGYELTRRAAELGFPVAQSNYGAHFEVYSARFDEAVRWYTAAADQDDADGLFHLGVCYLDAVGVPADLTKAFSMFRRAARLGHTSAQYRLAGLYEDGRLFPPHYDKAARWYERAANANLDYAQYRLAEMYEQGLGVPVDLGKAYVWLWLAATQDRNPDNPPFECYGLKDRLAPEQLARAKRLLALKQRFLASRIGSPYP